MKVFFTLFIVLTVGTAYGQSNLPACQGSDASKWSHCFGSRTTSNGYKYVGEWKDGKPNGYGTATYLNGDKYVGEYKDGNINGQGTFTWANGNKYVGGYKDGNINGQGTFTWVNGNNYVGEFKDGSRHGQGYMTLKNGFVGLGEYANNLPNGRFISYKPDGTIDYSGIVKDGKLVTSQYIDPNSFTRIARNNSAPAVSDSQR